MDLLAQSRNRIRVRRKLRDLSRHLNVGRAHYTAAADDRDSSAPPSALDRLIADGLVTPAIVAKRQRIAPLITANGTVSDLVTEQRG